MKRFSLLAVSFVFAAIFAVSAFGQGASPAQPAAGKIGLINMGEFADDKAGITKFRTALTTLDAQFKPLNDELNTMRTKYQTLATEIQKLQNPPAGVPVSTNNSTLSTKVEEAQSLEVQIKRKAEDGKARYEREYGKIVGPVLNDILKALNEYAKQKGYAVILDGAKLEQAEILLGFDEKYNVTKDFITFYNARPAGTATTAAPK